MVGEKNWNAFLVCSSCLFLIDVKQPSIMDVFSKPKATSSKPAKKVPTFDTSDSEGEAKTPVTKAKPVLKRKQADSDNSDSDSDNLMSRLKAKTTAGSKVSFTLNSNLRKGFYMLMGQQTSFYKSI